jgi:BlaI family penicillinase repressor
VAEPEAYRLGNLQLRIMQVLWAGGAATVSDVKRGLGGEPLAYTTVATMLRKMEDRGLVRHEEHGRRFLYEAAVAEDDVARSMAGDLVDRLFAGSLTDTVSHLLETRDISAKELSRLEELIKRHRQRR